MRKIRILSVATSLPHTYPPAYLWRIFNNARMLRSKGHDVTMVHYFRDSSMLQRDSASGDRLHALQTYLVPTSIPTVHVTHLMMVQTVKPDLVFANGDIAAFVSALGKTIGIPMVLDMHGGSVEEFLLYEESKIGLRHPVNLARLFLRRVITSVAMRLSDRILCVSKKMIKYLNLVRKVPLDKMIYVPNVVDLKFFRPRRGRSDAVRQELGLENKLVFGYVGNLQKWQGVDRFIEAARKIEDPGVAFVVVGGKRRSKKNNLCFLPQVARDRLVDYYALCDVLVLPRPRHIATEIAAPVKFVEYTAVGKPVLITNVGDAANLVRKYNCGIVVKDNSPRSLVKGIYEFKQKTLNEREAMGRNARKLAENEFDPERIVERLLTSLEDLLS